MCITQRELPVKPSRICPSPCLCQRTIDKFCVQLEGARHAMHESDGDEGGIMQFTCISGKDYCSTGAHHMLMY